MNTLKAGWIVEQGSPLIDHVIRVGQLESSNEKPTVQLWKAELRGLMERGRRKEGGREGGGEVEAQTRKEKEMKEKR